MQTTTNTEPNTTTKPKVERGRIVYHGGHRGNGRGIVLAVHGEFDLNKRQMLGGFIHVVTPETSGSVDVAWPYGSHPHVSNRLPQSIIHSLPYEIKDLMATEEDITKALEVIKAAEIQRKQDEDAANVARQQRRDKAIKDYAHLERVPQGGYSSAKLAAKNMRTELKSAFPGIKFSVTSDTFSGGDSVDISWTLGPTKDQVAAITGKYQDGHFNGMEDIYETNYENVFPDLFGGAKYVHEHRGVGDDAINLVASALCDYWSIAKPADGKTWWNIYAKDRCSDGHDMGCIARSLISHDAYPAGAVITGLERLNDGEEREGTGASWARYYRATFTAPEANAAPAASTEPVTVDGVTVTENHEKDGVEIRFPTKPDPSVLSRLKAAGWRWARFSSCWYHKRNEAALAFAKSLQNTTVSAS